MVCDTKIPKDMLRIKKAQYGFINLGKTFEPIRAAVLNSMGIGEFIRFERVLNNFIEFL